MAEPLPFQRSQLAFAAHLRDPDNNPPPSAVEERRIAVYRELLFNNINGFISNGFPVLRSLYAEDQWLRLVRRFFAVHKSKTPYFVEIAEEFLDFLENEYQPADDDPPFLLELAHYEWVELAMMVSRATLPTDVDRHGDLLAGEPVLSPLSECLAYQWPVQHISPEFRPDEPLEQPRFIIVSRPYDDDEVSFLEVNAVTARLFELLREGKGRTGLECLRQIADELQHPNPDVVIDGGRQILLKLHHARIVLGVRAKAA